MAFVFSRGRTLKPLPSSALADLLSEKPLCSNRHPAHTAVAARKPSSPPLVILFNWLGNVSIIHISSCSAPSLINNRPLISPSGLQMFGAGFLRLCPTLRPSGRGTSLR